MIMQCPDVILVMSVGCSCDYTVSGCDFGDVRGVQL